MTRKKEPRPIPKSFVAKRFAIALDIALYHTVFDWLKKDWPFSKVAFPGRSISWADWVVTLKVT